ncbi:NlpC/P60 family protein [Formivibrio citricus]|uniref:NlpC/P60 family protein n=2 Tax=Formivibrio citricus TaxID=83765 RepID=A0A1I4VBZ3_9NEIS|nr:NlpC/P60 family protein [Formivibrio citricus]
MRRFLTMGFILLPFLLNACGTSSTVKQSKAAVGSKQGKPVSLSRIEAEGAAREVVMFALGLLDVGYQFGGSNPEAGLDCSGMVRFIYKEAAGLDLPHNAAALAQISQPVGREKLQAGDLVFFNTRGFSYSHVGIYLGDNKFVHAPSSRGKIRVESLATPYFAQRYEGGRTLLAMNAR